MAPESTRSSSSTASRRLRGLLRRTLRVVRPISDTLAALGAAGQARRIAWTRSTVAQGTTPPLICRGARRHRCLPTYALAELPRKLAVLRRECERIGRDPATLRATEERRFGGPGWGFAAGGYCGTPEEVVARIRARARLGVQGVVFFLHDRAEPETLRLLADEVVPAVRDL